MMMVLVAGAFALYRLARGDRPGHAAADAAVGARVPVIPDATPGPPTGSGPVA